MRYGALLAGFLLGSLAAFPRGVAADDPAMKKKVEECWASEDFAGLEKLAASCRADAMDILDPFPRLSYFYAAIRGPGALSDAEAARRLARLERWWMSNPDSVTVRVVLVDLFVTEAWRARGPGWSKDVSEEGWRIFFERLSLAAKVLRDPGSKISVDPTLAGLAIVVAMALPGEDSGKMESFDSARRRWPGYFPIYDNVARALLPRWGGKPKAAAEFAASSADELPGPLGDGLYAMLAAMVLETEGLEDFQSAGFDHARFLRGLDVLAEKGETSYRYQAAQRAAYLEAVLGDPGAARTRIFSSGPVFLGSAYGGDSKVRPAWEKAGVLAELNKGIALEKAGRLDEAEAFYASLTDTRPNPWIPSFALRNGVQRLWPEEYGTPITGLPLDKANANQIFEMACRAMAAGDLDAAKNYATSFDRQRPQNLTGKLILLASAGLTNDAVTFEQEKARFLAMATDRTCYKLAQDYVAGRRTWNETRALLPRDQYFIQACSIMGASALGSGHTSEAREIFQEVHETFPFQPAAAIPESMLWGALARKFPDRLARTE